MIVLDTHAWIWWATDRTRLSASASEAIAAADELGVSAVSAWEVAMLAASAGSSFAFTNATPLTIGTVDGITGVRSFTNNAQVSITADSLDIASALSVPFSGNSSITLMPFTNGVGAVVLDQWRQRRAAARM